MNKIEELIGQLCPENNNRVINDEIPPFSRNDEQPCVTTGGNSGGEAARISTCSLISDAVISSEARNLISKNKRHSEQSEETKQIPPVGRNDEQLHGFKVGSFDGEAAKTSYPLHPKNDCHFDLSAAGRSQRENSYSAILLQGFESLPFKDTLWQIEELAWACICLIINYYGDHFIGSIDKSKTIVNCRSWYIST